ncbi:unnamed protein product [Miscanthus lutarioriparius]|uniref:Uncharacterized protein n=1 Tax=Miscanthus lutarioriparius TaxID=422564 RepID=A0A811MYD2_9POAL|nr:unnamed protein product [Miscanthus lutarioriparius]
MDLHSLGPPAIWRRGREGDINEIDRWDGSSNLKWQGGGAVASSTPPKPKAAPKKRFQEDSENQDPALATPPPRQAPTSRPPFGAPRWNKNAKEAIKSRIRSDLMEKVSPDASVSNPVPMRYREGGGETRNSEKESKPNEGKESGAEGGSREAKVSLCAEGSEGNTAHSATVSIPIAKPH